MAHATVYVCDEGQLVFRSTPCHETVPTVAVYEERTRTYWRPAARPKEPKEEPKRAMDSCTADSDCSKGMKCRVRAGNSRGVCYF